jgi:hypothetical protein
MRHSSYCNCTTEAACSLALGLVLAACGQAPDSVGTSSPEQPGGSGSATAPIILGDASARGTGGTKGSPLAGDAICGVEISDTTKEPTDVLLVLDRSGSMNESIAAECCCSSTCRQLLDIKMCPSTSGCTERWPALTSAVTTTISQAAGIRWGLKLFSSQHLLDACGVDSGVELGIGASASSVQARVAGAAPEGGTPTAAAIVAATAHLNTVHDASSKVILLATDGEPNCKSRSLEPNTVDLDGTRRAIAAALAAGFRTYVIGIGPSVGNLDDFAVAGGTEKHFRTASAAELAGALATISKAVASCTFTMSRAPDDPANIAVYLDGSLLANDPANGWTFGATTQAVILKGAACARITSGAATSVRVLFGCPGEPPPPDIIF